MRPAPPGDEFDLVDEMVAAWKRRLPPFDEATMEFAKRLALLQRRLAEDTARAAAAYGIGPGEFDVLATLLRLEPDPVRPRTLSASLMWSTGGVSNALRRLESDGLVERRPDPEDGRGAIVTLSERGREVAKSAVAESVKAHERTLSAADQAEIRRLAKSLRRVGEALGS